MDEKVTVRLTDDHVGRTDKVASELRAAGLNIDQILSNVGIITGSVDSKHRDAVAGVSGVAGVDSEQTFQIAPPDAEVQ